MLNRGNKVIAVFGVTRDDIASGIAHARTGAGSLPVWVWCAGPCEPPPACDRFHPNATASSAFRDLRQVWPALSIVPWNGSKKAPALKLLPLLIPPFRVVAFNEARGFFAVRPGSLLNHAGRRLRDASISGGRRLLDWYYGLGRWLHSVGYRTAERLRDVVNLAWNFLLAALAIAVKPTAPWARRALTRSGARVPLAEIGTALGSTFKEIKLANRDWPRRRILEALSDPDVDFIVFRRPGEVSAAEPLVAMARETNSFAVTRQSAWSGWRETVLHKHPFRVLQTGEVTRVEAPHSTLIAMRCDLLRKLGVPERITSGAALMEIYWQAEAAGLQSIVAGDGGPTPQEPAMELEDLEFVLRKSKGPAAPSTLSRGNVAWSPHHRKPFRGKPRVLVVSPYLPFPLSHGGAVRIYNLCRTLSNEIDFVLACFREKNETVRYEELHEIFREVYVVDIDEKHVDPDVPAQISGYRNSAMAALLDRPVDLIQLEYTQVAEYRRHAGSVPTILVEHDITFTLHRQLGNAQQARLWQNFEEEALRAASAVWTMSGRDRALAIEHGAPPQSTVAVENGVDLHRFRPMMKTRPGQRILFVGSFRHLPNLIAFRALRDTIMPAVWERWPETTLHVIAGPNRTTPANLDRRILIEGFIEDVRPAYRNADIAVVPLTVSAGTNIKVMEAMACGRAVVSTPLGCQGLELRDASDVLIRDAGPEFAAAITLLLGDDELRTRIGQRARETAERRFDWDSIAGCALQSYAGLLGDMMSASNDSSTIREVPSDLLPLGAGTAE